MGACMLVFCPWCGRVFKPRTLAVHLRAHDTSVCPCCGATVKRLEQHAMMVMWARRDVCHAYLTFILRSGVPLKTAEQILSVKAGDLLKAMVEEDARAIQELAQGIVPMLRQRQQTR